MQPLITTDDARVPNLTLPLVEALERLFPDVCPDPETSDKDVHIKMGEARVVRFLRREYESQFDNSQQD